MLLRGLLLLLLTMVACWPTWSLPDWDGTEGRRVQIALEMLGRGDWLVPTLGHEPTLAKPPLHYWLLAAVQQWLGNDRLWLRLPGLLSAAAAAWLCGELLRRWFGARTGWIGALGIACSPLVLHLWPTAEIDPLFATATAASLWCLATGVAREQRALVVAAGLLGGIALLQKGPPYFVFAAGAWLVWWRHRRLRFFVPYLVPMLLVALAYYVPLWVLRIAPSEMLAVASEESVGRVAFYEWKHVRDIPAFWLRAAAVQLPLLLWCFWEWRGPRDARMDASDLTLRMCSGAAVLAVVLLTVFPGRPTRYLMPNVLLFPFAVAPAVANFMTFPGALPRFAQRVVEGIGLLGAVGLLVVPFVPRLGLGSLGLAAAAAVLPLLVRTPAAVVVACLVLPVVGAWTVGLDRTLAWVDGPRSRLHAGEVLQRELQRLGGAASEALHTVGHFDSPLLLAAGLLPPGDEWERRPWRGRWVLHEYGDIEVHPPANYVERVRLHLPFKSFAIRERVDAGR
ncbi:MAG: glycosyltransferase family 39 protein [Planctomycetes bacterium]|nr:glycosyltransferase family 39 protein [Planctomycetota bacterium]